MDCSVFGCSCLPGVTPALITLLTACWIIFFIIFPVILWLFPANSVQLNPIHTAALSNEPRIIYILSMMRKTFTDHTIEEDLYRSYHRGRPLQIRP